ncbi:curli assembly protein CsgF [Flavobacterium sp.]|uniref:curli assembly protein CsgF n=1 Tax=Flavobacterium sp. TaxID=239 RepID=UPI003752629E
MKILLNILIVLIAGQVYSQDLVYKPRNPNFGGDTFNYQWLLSSAEAQNLYKEDDSGKLKQKTDLQKFTDNLNNQLLNQVSKSLFQQQFGTNGITTGVYNFGSLSVEIYQSNLGLVISILDTNTGEQTQLIIP